MPASGGAASRRSEYGLPVLSGVLLALSFPPLELLVPPFIALVPFLLHVSALPAGPDGRRRATRGGFALGLVYFGLILHWMIIALIYYSLLAIPAYILTVLILASFSAGFAAALHYVLDRQVLVLAPAAAVLWTAFEWLQGNLHDVSFPWLGLGTTLSAFPRIAGAADLVGARGLSFWIVLVNGLIAGIVLAYRAHRPVARQAMLLGLTLVVPVAYGFWRAATLELWEAAKVAVVQPNIPEELKLDRLRAVDSSMVALANLTRQITPGSVDLVVWPEVALPAVIEHESVAHLRGYIETLSKEVQAPILAGAYGMEERADGGFKYFNSAMLLTQDGFVGETYHKQFLVPFVERIPFIHPDRLRGIIGELRYFGGLGRGDASVVLGEPGARFGVLICYESIFEQGSRRFRREGADFLLNITNDAWFGREPRHTRTGALWQHPAHMPMRAIENRMGVARSANTGISMFVDPLGRRYEATELFVPDVRTATVYTTDVLTVFSRFGDWPGTMAAVGALLLLAAAWRTGRRRDPGSGAASCS